VKYYNNWLTSLYLRNIDNIYIKSEYPSIFVLFYELVRLILYYYYAFDLDFKILTNYFF
jgi:hypothetical protein